MLAEQAQRACELSRIYELLGSKNNSCATERRTELPPHVPCRASRSRERGTAPLPGAALAEGSSSTPHLTTAAGQARPALIKRGIIRNPALQHTRCLTAESHPHSPARGDPGVLRALLEGGCWNTRARGRLQILQRRAADHAATSAGPRCTFSTTFPGVSIPARSKRQKRHPRRWRSTPTRGPRGRGGLQGVLSVARGAWRQGLVAAPYPTIRRGSADAQLYYR